MRCKMEEKQQFISAVIAPEYIDVEMTKMIKQHISNKKTPFYIDNTTAGKFDFAEKCEAYEKLRNCKELISSCNFYGRAYGVSVLEKNNIQTNELLICLCFDSGNFQFGARDICVIILPTTILLFKNENKRTTNHTTFLCALFPTAFRVNFIEKFNVDKEVVIQEKSKEPLEYYDQFNPYSDSTIVARKWEKTNLDGSRSFAGGLKPENNPLHLTLEYAKITIHVCGCHIDIGVSNVDVAQKFASMFDNFSESNCEMISKEQQTIRQKCIEQYLSNSNNKRTKKFWKTIKKHPILILPLIFGLAVGLVIIWGIIEIMLVLIL